MKKKMLAATAIIAAAGLIALIIKRKKSTKITQMVEPGSHRSGHHLTNVFAKAKEQLI